MDLKTFLIEKKNQKLFLLGTVSLFIFIFAIATLSFFLIRSKNLEKKTSKTVTTDFLPTKPPVRNNEETIQSLGYSIDCQLTVTTSVKKLFVKKFDRCGAALDYKLSPSKKYTAFLRSDKNNIPQLFIYSLENNIEGQLQIITQPFISYQFDSRNNLALFFKDKLTYYFIPLLFTGYPENYYKELDVFTDTDKRKTEVVFPESVSYAKIAENQNGFVLMDASGRTVFTIGFADLDRELSPTPLPDIDRRLLNWKKRIFFFSQNQFKTTDIDGTNELIHQFICDGIEVIPIGFQNSLMARSPDGETLAFLAPTEAQMRENPNWKKDILSGKKVFDRGEIALYDFVKSDCQKTGIEQSIQFRESFSFSPNGQYLAFVNKGVSLYSLYDHQDYQLVSHNPTLETDSTAVSGPLIWDGTSKFIFTLVSKLSADGKILSTNMVRIYFDERLNGSEQSVIPLSNNTLYAVSSDGLRVLYSKNNQIYIYNVDRKINSLFSNGPIDKIHKLVWLRNGLIVSNIWYANENLYFTKLPEMNNFQIDFDGENIAYATNSAQTIMLYDLGTKRQKFFKDKKTIEGTVLQLYY